MLPLTFARLVVFAQNLALGAVVGDFLVLRDELRKEVVERIRKVTELEKTANGVRKV